MCLFMTKHDLTLSEYIASVRENNSFIPMERVIDYAKQISSGLAFLHTHQIVHRDIKVRSDRSLIFLLVQRRAYLHAYWCT